VWWSLMASPVPLSSSCGLIHKRVDRSWRLYQRHAPRKHWQHCIAAVLLVRL